MNRLNNSQGNLGKFGQSMAARNFVEHVFYVPSDDESYNDDNDDDDDDDDSEDQKSTDSVDLGDSSADETETTTTYSRQNESVVGSSIATTVSRDELSDERDNETKTDYAWTTVTNDRVTKKTERKERLIDPTRRRPIVRQSNIRRSERKKKTTARLMATDGRAKRTATLHYTCRDNSDKTKTTIDDETITRRVGGQQTRQTRNGDGEEVAVEPSLDDDNIFSDVRQSATDGPPSTSSLDNDKLLRERVMRNASRRLQNLHVAKYADSTAANLRRDQILRVSCGFGWDDWNNIFDRLLRYPVSTDALFAIFVGLRDLGELSKTELRRLIKAFHPDKSASHHTTTDREQYPLTNELNKVLLQKVLRAYKP